MNQHPLLTLYLAIGCLLAIGCDVVNPREWPILGRLLAMLVVFLAWPAMIVAALRWGNEL